MNKKPRNEKVQDLKHKLAKVRERLNDPDTPRQERPRLRLQRDACTWLLERIAR